MPGGSLSCRNGHIPRLHGTYRGHLRISNFGITMPRPSSSNIDRTGRSHCTCCQAYQRYWSTDVALRVVPLSQQHRANHPRTPDGKDGDTRQSCKCVPHRRPGRQAKSGDRQCRQRAGVETRTRRTTGNVAGAASFPSRLPRSVKRLSRGSRDRLCIAPHYHVHQSRCKNQAGMANLISAMSGNQAISAP